ncbi:Chemotaxis protein methyltransferase [Azospirillaceae bacterium]
MFDAGEEAPRLSERAFRRLAELVEKQVGIRMPPGKRVMLEGRLRRRLRERGMTGFNEYCDFLFQKGGLEEELGDLIDVVTTNKTEFFREPKHFEYLISEVLPDLTRRGFGVERPLRVWSAGCSVGAEAYTLAMVLSEWGRNQPEFSVEILGTDVCSTVLKTATKAMYSEEMAEPIPLEMRRRYLLRSRDRAARLIRMAPEVRGLACFSRLNFMDADYRLPTLQDVVFCRNVIIYFDNAVRLAVLGRICRCMIPGGFLFMGHSETIDGLHLPLRKVSSTVYVRT